MSAVQKFVMVSLRILLSSGMDSQYSEITDKKNLWKLNALESKPQLADLNVHLKLSTIHSVH